ncbi:MAG: flagellar modification protein B, partial [Haliea sp.]
MNTIITVCARGGSQGLPGKNLRPLLGKPLIVWTIEQALESRLASDVYVSTDDPAIAAAARAAGAVVPFTRPAELSTAAAGKLPVVLHLVEWVEAHGTPVSKIIDL